MRPRERGGSWEKIDEEKQMPSLGDGKGRGEGDGDKTKIERGLHMGAGITCVPPGEANMLAYLYCPPSKSIRRILEIYPYFRIFVLALPSPVLPSLWGWGGGGEPRQKDDGETGLQVCEGKISGGKRKKNRLIGLMELRIRPAYLPVFLYVACWHVGIVPSVFRSRAWSYLGGLVAKTVRRPRIASPAHRAVTDLTLVPCLSRVHAYLNPVSTFVSWFR
ncbi:hypothetical protein GGS21DRAFT_398083 [Xylaria nigripes]|nr:hypothetical protein GGS21DRAFT_398083 [Xylaria nigripes]